MKTLDDNCITCTMSSSLHFPPFVSFDMGVMWGLTLGNTLQTSEPILDIPTLTQTHFCSLLDTIK